MIAEDNVINACIGLAHTFFARINGVSTFKSLRKTFSMQIASYTTAALQKSLACDMVNDVRKTFHDN